MLDSSNHFDTHFLPSSSKTTAEYERRGAPVERIAYEGGRHAFEECRRVCIGELFIDGRLHVYLLAVLTKPLNSQSAATF